MTSISNNINLSQEHRMLQSLVRNYVRDDILAIEHFLCPGTLIVVDGRTANARFIKTNLQRDWDYWHSKEYDQHFFELKEKPLGVFNQRQVDFCLGKDWGTT